ncbi:MAG: autotransporter-associated beta strand repeat-containing protein [Chthoniobacteraceae bacterium]
MRAGGTLGLAGVDLSGRALTLGGAGSTNVTGAITGAGSLQKTGAGTLTLSGGNSFTGEITVSAGTLNVAGDSALGAVGAGNGTEILAGASLVFGDPVGINIHTETLRIAGNGTAGTSAIQSLLGENISEGAVTLTADASVNIAAGTLTLSGGISDLGLARSLAKNGAGDLVLGGTNTFTGMLAVNAGTLRIAADNTLGGAPGFSLAAGATLDLDDFSDSLGSLSGAGTVTFGTLGTGGGTLSVGANGASTTFTGSITGTGDFEKTGAGALTLTTANTYVGNTTVSGGMLVAGNNLAFGAATQTITVDGGALGSNLDSRSLAYGIVVGTTPGSGIGGTNSLTLTGAVSSAGAGSSLEVNFADTSKAVTVNPSVAGSFAPGELLLTGGTLILGGANKIADTTDVVLAGGTLRTGGFSDRLGAMTLSADSTIDFGTSNNVRLEFGDASWTGGTLTILNWTGTPARANNADQLLFSGSFSQDLLDRINFQGAGYLGAIAFDRGGGLYEVVPVPEPTTIIGAMALVGLIGFRERRRLARFCRSWP